MKKVISFSLFGAAVPKRIDCYSIEDFMRFLSINIRAYKTMFKNWDIVVHTDRSTFNAYYLYFTMLKVYGIIKLVISETSPTLCEAMLWRIKPVAYADYTICRDIDSLPSSKEVLAVNEWIHHGTQAHVMNDHPMHGIPIMGGMCGFRQMDLPNPDTCDGIDFSVKGSDQVFLERYIYPMVTGSITEHRFCGYHTDADNPYSYTSVAIPPLDTHEIFKPVFMQTDSLVPHIGAPGFILDPHIDHLGNHNEGAISVWRKNCDPILDGILANAEIRYPKIFYWIKNDES